MFLSDLSDTISFGVNFAKQIDPQSIILLKGPIGAGKTSFVQGLAKGLLIKEHITSPTFALCHHYDSVEISLIHMDLYRLENYLSAQEIFLEEREELKNQKGIMVVEWPELIIPIIDSYWLIEMNYGKNFGRECTVNHYRDKESR